MKKAFNLLVLFMVVWLPFGNKETKAAAVPAGFFSEANNKDLGFWELPSILREVSGIKYLGDNRFACIQEAAGSIFIYNTTVGAIEKEIPFSEPGDFEGIAIAGTSAYVVNSDGMIYEVQDYDGAKPVVTHYATPLSANHDVEGLTYDKKNNRLLLAIKGSESRNTHYKGVYAFDLKSKRLATKPVARINLDNPIFMGMNGNNKSHSFQPSAIEIHPVTNDIYILQGTNPKLLVMDTKGRIKKLYSFNQSDLPHAEGLAFSPEGELFISNEGKDGAATIVKVAL